MHRHRHGQQTNRGRFRRRFGFGSEERGPEHAGERKGLAIVGSPNVGKSVMFNRLTGMYATVSNYPGTTVEVARGKGQIEDLEIEVVDTPGMYALLPITEEERVARTILLEESVDLVMHMIDAKNLPRMLPLTLQLIEAGLPVILVVNVMDEAERLGIHLDLERLEREIGIPVIPTISTTGKGIAALKRRIYEYLGDGDPHRVQ